MRTTAPAWVRGRGGRGVLPHVALPPEGRAAAKAAASRLRTGTVRRKGSCCVRHPRLAGLIFGWGGGLSCYGSSLCRCTGRWWEAEPSPKEAKASV